MNDMTAVIVPKSDQINADDLIAGPMTITITDVQIRGGQEQPVSIFFAGSEKAFRPCKSMSRVLVQGWGADAKAYIGRSLTLYRDPTVKWAGLEVGGIRISHMSHIEGEKLMMLTATKGSRKPHKVKPLETGTTSATPRAKAEAWLASYETDLKAATTTDQLAAIHEKATKAVAKLATQYPDLHERALALRPAVFDSSSDDGTFDVEGSDTPNKEAATEASLEGAE